MTVNCDQDTLPFAVGMECNVVDRTEVIANAAELLFEYEMEEARLELARLAVQSGVDGLLTTTKQHVIADGRDGRRVHRLLRLVHLKLIQALNVKELVNIQRKTRSIINNCI